MLQDQTTLHENRKIVGVLVYLERRKTRKLVGELTYDDVRKKYVFRYDKGYLLSRLVSLGPELPKSNKTYTSDTLFVPFEDRFPCRENPAYPDYCDSQGISVDEKDPFVLLTTIAKRGPSSFVFEARYENTFDLVAMKKFRNELQLTNREFGIAFAITEKTLITIEKGKTSGRDTMKRLELYIRFPEVALFEFQRHSASIHIDKRRFVEEVLRKKIDKS